MDRKQIFPGQIPLETDLLGTNKNVMIALGKLAAAVFGTGNYINGLTVGPNSPAALNVVVQPGELYSLQNVDNSAYSSIAADTTHQIVKQGILMDSVTLSTSAPATVGYSVNYLIQAAFSEVDTDAVVLPYYNASNPTQAYSGPAGAGTTNNTTRKNTISLSAKAGIAAATGTQTTPAADAGYIGLCVVTVANGQTSVTSGNISVVAGAPYYGNAALLGRQNAFSVSPTMPTPAQFDSSTTAATTAWVNTRGLQYAGINQITGATTLTVSHIGSVCVLGGGTAYTATLPASAGLPVGAQIEFFSQNSGGVTIAPNGADAIYGDYTASKSFVLRVGDSVTMVYYGSGIWMPKGASQFQYSTVFKGSAATTGSMHFASGHILNWGLDTTTLGPGASRTITLPESYVSGHYFADIAVQSFATNDQATLPKITISDLVSFTLTNTDVDSSIAAYRWWSFGK